MGDYSTRACNISLYGLHLVVKIVLVEVVDLSGIYVRRCNINLKREVPLLSVSPCQLKMSGNSKAIDNDGLEVVGSQKNRKTNDVLLKTKSDTNMGIIEWSTHERVLAALSNGLPSNKDEEAATQSIIKKGLHNLLHAWHSAHLHAIASNAGVEVNSLVLGTESLLHFVVKDYSIGKHGKVQTSSNFSFGITNRIGEPWIDILYVLSISEEPLHDDKVYAYEFVFDKGNMGDNNLSSSELLVGKLSLGDPVYFCSVKERTSNKFFSPKISSLGWMGTAASDIMNSRLELAENALYSLAEELEHLNVFLLCIGLQEIAQFFSLWLIVVLCPASGGMLSSYSLPFPGHVLIHGPTGSGKTLLATAVSKSVEEHEDILAHIVFVYCSKLALEKSATIRQALSGYVSEALDHAPSVVIFDDLDSIISSSTDLEGSQPSSSVIELAQFLTDIMDEYEFCVILLCFSGRFKGIFFPLERGLKLELAENALYSLAEELEHLNVFLLCIGLQEIAQFFSLWIYVRRCNINLKREVPLLSVSPCQLKMSGNSKAIDNDGLEVVGSQKNRKTNDVLLKTKSDTNMGIIEWSTHERVLAALSNGLPSNKDEEAATQSIIKKGLHNLLHAWHSAHLHAIASNAGVEVNSLVLGTESLLHFVVKDYSIGKHGKVQTSSNFSFGITNRIGEPWIDILYVLSISEEPLHDDKVYAYEFVFDKGNMGDNNLSSSELLVGKLSLGDPVYFYSVKERTSNKFFSPKISSLGWMGTAASDIINSRYFLLNISVYHYAFSCLITQEMQNFCSS
ncbi:hypothetical protein TEA_020793 [Camellia sinensis var. sinensis]|uniref:AAA+ ATPase domain-containing protein n=1 Tax=Camellia sinensis var. sinensis TaxID=542762 RepID=A0A4V3WKN5_CAMSN|nr:hypothetical protein TEA_020793 [Camellia sinensis var. sinensis]